MHHIILPIFVFVIRQPPNKSQSKPNSATKPNRTEPNQTKPNQTKPNQTKPNHGHLTGSWGPWHRVLGAPLAYPWRKKAKLLEVEGRDATADFWLQ